MVVYNIDIERKEHMEKILTPSQVLTEMESIVSDYQNGIIDKNLCINCLRNLHRYACRMAGSVCMVVREKYQAIENKG